MLEVGVVCGRCDTLSVLGTRACASCHADLTLAAPRTSLPSGGPTELRARAGLTEPPSSFAQDPPLPRRRGSGPTQAVPAPVEVVPPPPQSIRAIRAQGGDTAVATSGAFDTRGSSSLKAPGEGSSRRLPVASRSPLEEQMEQAKNYVCRSCSTAVPLGHKFCGRCGAPVPTDVLNARTHFFGQLQTPGRAKLILIRGEGVEGLSYQLNAEQHIVGRSGQLVFSDDPFISPRHANLFYRNGKLVARDEGSTNGVFVRVRGTIDLASGDELLAGEQLFRFEKTPRVNDGPSADGTTFYSSPKQPSDFRVVQVLQGGAPGMVVCARGDSLQIGREGSDLNFPADLYMSASHCRIEQTPRGFTLTDMNSRNGTYVRLRSERELDHGDYLFIGRKLLRVEVTAA